MPSTRPQPQRSRSRAAQFNEVTRLSNDDIYLFGEGTHYQLYNHLGSHAMTVDGVAGTYFAVWAPNADAVFVEGDFNDWNKSTHPLRAREGSGIWEGFIPGVGKGAHYKYFIHSRFHGYRVEKADPYALFCEQPPKSASIVWDLEYEWNDAAWMEQRRGRNDLQAPISVYELHLGSWAHNEQGFSFSYRELAERLTEYVVRMGFTHVELMPVMEHPFYGSWGYQCTGYFAPTSRFGSPQDFMYLVDRLHQAGIGVILDWVPSHFTTDDYGLGYFDGTHLYEHADPRQGYHPDWGSNIFNYSRNEVRNFLISSGLFWLEKYHIDGIRVDAVASMLYLDYSRNAGEWIPNEYGGNENIAAIGFLRDFNSEVYRRFPDVQTIAEESTAWPMVSRPTYVGGLGFGLKWDMGWMHDTLQYFSRDPIHRKFHHNYLTFRMLYAFNENFMMPLSHDEVVHGKASLLGKMPGDEWQRFANLRLLYGNLFGNPGKKLIFMGGEFGAAGEWNHDKALEWWVLQYPNHAGMQNWVRDLNRIYREQPALHRHDTRPDGFQWIDCDDVEASTLSYLRTTDRPEDGAVLAIFNFTPVVRPDYRIGVPSGGWWRELVNSDATCYWGSGVGNGGGAEAVPEPSHGRPWSLKLTLPPLAVLFFKCDRLG